MIASPPYAQPGLATIGSEVAAMAPINTQVFVQLQVNPTILKRR
jgi:hypothetical protein